MCKLVSRNEFNYTRFRDVALALPSAINAKNAILDGELVVLDRTGKARFYDLMAGRGYVVFAAFDLMWLNGRDLRDQPLWGRKELLRLHLRNRRVAFCLSTTSKVTANDCTHRSVMRDMEGIVCKPMISPYRPIRGTTTWIKVKNPNYSQAEGRGELFNKRR